MSLGRPDTHRTDPERAAHLAAYYDAEVLERAARGLSEQREQHRDLFIEAAADSGAESVLELGCGPGLDAMALAVAGLSYTGVDADGPELRGVWTVYRQRGADHLVVSGIVVTPADRDTLTAAIPEAGFTFCRLTATPATVQQRIVDRREAEAATQGSVLSADTRAELVEYGHRSVEFSELLERFALEDFALATDEATPHQLAVEAIRRYFSADSTTPSTN